MNQTQLKMLLVLLAATLFVPASWTQEIDESGRGVARISVLNGDVSVRRGDGGDWIAAAINAPLVVTDTMLTGTASRAEVQLDWANLIRLAANTEVRFSELEYERFQIQVAAGTITYSVIRDSNADIDLATPNVSVRPVRKGRYRVSVHSDGTTEVTVRSGEAEIYTPRGVEYLRSGKSMLVRGTISDPEFRFVSAASKDEWDRWNERRDKELRQSAAYNYVSRDIYGAEDLDGYGSWVHVSSYGWVWQPRVAVGWAPYRYGRWTWVDWYGWSWVSYDPWGWAPYHYGRWFHHGGRWRWWPGRPHVRHHWSPGLVAFFGWNSHRGFSLGVSVGFGNVGWVPLAPYEPFHPWYGRGYYRGYRGGNRTYIDNSVNIVNNTNITNIYRNSRVSNGVTAVDGREFGRGHVRNVYHGDDGVLRRANLVRGQVPVVPQSESVRLASREVNRANLASSGSRDTFYTRRTARPVDRVSFAEQQRGMERVVQRAGGSSSRTAASTARRAGNSTSRSAAATRADGGAASPAATRTNRGGGGSTSGLATRTAGSASQGQPSTATRPTTTRSAGGWQRFEGPASSTNASRSRTAGSTPSASRGGGQAAGVSGGASAPAATRSGSTTRSTGGWTRFGEPSRARTSTSRGAVSQGSAASGSGSGSRSGASARRSSGGSTAGWQRFGEPAGRTNATRSRTAGSAPSASRGGGQTTRGSSGASAPANTRSGSATRSTGGWSRFDSSSRSSGSRSGTSGRSSAPSRNSGASSRGSSSNSGARTQRSAPSTNSIRVRPPIVTPRSAPRSSGTSRDSGRSSSPRIFGGSSRSSGRTSSPRISGGSSGSRSTSGTFSSPRRSAPSAGRSSSGRSIRSAPSASPSRSSGSVTRSAPSRPSSGGSRSSSSGRGGRR